MALRGHAKNALRKGFVAVRKSGVEAPVASDVIVVDRLPFGSPLEPVDAMERSLSTRWFLDIQLPRCVQKVRRLASWLSPSGALVVMDGQSAWAETLWESFPENQAREWRAYQTWLKGGA